MMFIYYGSKCTYRIGITSPHAVYANFMYIEIDERNRHDRFYINDFKEGLQTIAECEHIEYKGLLKKLRMEGIE